MRQRHECVDLYGCDFAKQRAQENPFANRPRRVGMLSLKEHRAPGEIVREGRHFRKIVKRVLPSFRIRSFGWDNVYLVRDFGVNDCLR